MCCFTDNVIDILKQNGYEPLPKVGSHERWKHPLLLNYKPIMLSTKSGADLVHHRTVNQLEQQLLILAGMKKGEGSVPSSSTGQLPQNGKRKRKGNR